jgi:uncharacterized protein
MTKRKFRVRDPIHGFISLSQVEHDIIDCRAFQRLRNIRQLSFTYMAYPGAEHSRFGHSLGVGAISGRIFDSLIEKHYELISTDLKWNQDDVRRNRNLLSIASLLHDVGHPPFSHASEDYFPSGLGHEDYTRKIILESEIGDVINKHSGDTAISAEDIAEFFSDTGKLDKNIQILRPIFAGEVDSDKMDYLLRDSLYAGVSYGRYDLDRLIQSLCFIENPTPDGNFIIAVEEGGVHALEALVLARYFMFTQVYYHKVARAYYLHLDQFLKQNQFKYPSDIATFLSWDDVAMIRFLLEHRSDPHAAAIVDRKHFKHVFHSSEHLDKEEYKKTQKLEKAVRQKFGDVSVFCDYAEKASHKFHNTDFYVCCDNGRNILIRQFSGIISRLESIDQFRVYCEKSIRCQVEQFCNEFK